MRFLIISSGFAVVHLHVPRKKKNFIYISYGNLQSTRLGFFCCTNTCAPMVSSYYLMFLFDARLKFSVKTMPLSLLIILKALRESKREMANATRGIEKEIGALQLEEKKLVAEIKRTAKTGNHGPTKILARQLIRLRQQIANLQGSRAQMRGIATHTQAMHAQSSLAVGMKGASKAMAAMNKQMAPAKQAKVICEFQKQSAQK